MVAVILIFFSHFSFSGSVLLLISYLSAMGFFKKKLSVMKRLYCYSFKTSAGAAAASRIRKNAVLH